MSAGKNEPAIYTAVKADIEKKLAATEERIAALDQERAKHEQERANLKTALEGINLLLSPNESVSLPSPRPPEGRTPRRSISYASLSLPESTIRYLREVRTPQMTKDLAEGLIKKGVSSKSENFYRTLLSALGRARQEPDSPLTFVNHKWGLKEWGR